VQEDFNFSNSFFASMPKRKWTLLIAGNRESKRPGGRFYFTDLRRICAARGGSPEMAGRFGSFAAADAAW